MEKGYILHEGKSKLDGKPIVVIATMKSANRKTGNMVQTWILRSDIDPVQVSQSKQDFSICGNCPHRQSLRGDCYVNIGQAPLSVYRGFKRGIYKDISQDKDFERYFIGASVRFGAYGDPVLIPLRIVKKIAGVAKNHTGYTHQWKKARFQSYNKFFMASVDNIVETSEAIINKWRYFRASRSINLAKNEIECVSETRNITCKKCGLCNGFNNRKSIVIKLHGSRVKKLVNA